MPFQGHCNTFLILSFQRSKEFNKRIWFLIHFSCTVIFLLVSTRIWILDHLVIIWNCHSATCANFRYIEPSYSYLISSHLITQKVSDFVQLLITCHPIYFTILLLSRHYQATNIQFFVQLLGYNLSCNSQCTAKQLEFHIKNGFLISNHLRHSRFSLKSTEVRL